MVQTISFLLIPSLSYNTELGVHLNLNSILSNEQNRHFIKSLFLLVAPNITDFQIDIAASTNTSVSLKWAFKFADVSVTQYEVSYT